ncbi:30S ribosomal protein S2 [Patescibacteria group bacterium]|nr:30S ribosomal protein S2 [Patescibacteria group bacterium]
MEDQVTEEIKSNVEELSNIKEDVKKVEEASEEISGINDEEKTKPNRSKKKTNLNNLKKEAEKESLEISDIELRKKALLEKAEKLRKKLSEEAPKTEELKEQIKLKKKTEMLIPLEEYVKAGIYLGTKVVTPDMKPFVYRRRADGLAIFNTDLIDEKIKEAAEFLSKFNAKDIILVCKRQSGWRTARMFGELTGIRVFTKKYPAGILTNTNLKDFFENELTIVCDGWLDKNALKDTLDVHKKVLMVCDTNNFSKGADKIIIGNNKSAKSLGLIFYLLATEFCKAKKLSKNIPDLVWWTEESEES